jgi:hypothetical protein
MPTKVQQLEDHLMQWLDDQPMPPSRGTEQSREERIEAVAELTKLMVEENRWKEGELGGLGEEHGSEEWKAMIRNLQAALIEKFNNPRG